jgi:hypothetical protein
VTRVWTVASWHLGAAADATDAVTDALDAIECDNVAIQWIRSRQARAIADRLDLPYAWARSHHPTSRLIPGSAVGLAVLTPHRIARSAERPVGEHTSLWSSQRRVMQIVTVSRSDRTSYTLCHGTAALPARGVDVANGPPVLVVGEPSGPGLRSPIALPNGATSVSTEHRTPNEGANPLVVASFEMTWVEGGFATG